MLYMCKYLINSKYYFICNIIIEVSLQIWDTAGQERFRSMAPMYYRGAKAAVLVFDVTNEESFNRVSTWLRDLKAHADPDVVICLAGNKCDKTPTFNMEECEKEAAALGAKFFKTSALTGDGINEVFESLSISVVDVYKNKNSPDKTDTIDVNQSTETQVSVCC